jgi:hypothetical protein
MQLARRSEKSKEFYTVTRGLPMNFIDEVSGHSSNPLTETENSGVGRCIKEPSLCKVTAIFTASGPPTLGSIRLNKGTVVTLIKQALEYVGECIAFAMMACSSLAQ